MTVVLIHGNVENLLGYPRVPLAVSMIKVIAIMKWNVVEGIASRRTMLGLMANDLEYVVKCSCDYEQ